jgi:TRAP-type C4-dicarboxylate transport system substrate-binding protein
MNTVFTENEEIQQEFSTNNVKLLVNYNTPRANLICATPVDDVASAKGLTTRVSGGAWIGDAEALGMNTTFIPNVEVYEALQRQIIDCVALPAYVFRDSALWDVAKHYVPAAFSSFPGSTYVMNLDKWNALPSEVQTIFDEARTTLISEWIKNDLAGYADFAKRGVAEHNVVFEDSAALDAVLVEHQADVIDGLAATAPSGLSNPDEFIHKYRDGLDKWMAVLTEDAGIPIQPEGPNSAYDSYVKNYDLQPYFDALNDSLNSR